MSDLSKANPWSQLDSSATLPAQNAENEPTSTINAEAGTAENKPTTTVNVEAGTVENKPTPTVNAEAGTVDNESTSTVSAETAPDDTVPTVSEPKPNEAATTEEKKTEPEKSQDEQPKDEQPKDEKSKDEKSKDEKSKDEKSKDEQPQAEKAAEEPMGFMDHFRELRGRLVKSFLAVIVGFIVCWCLRSYLVDFLFQPLLDALLATNQPGQVVALGVAEKFFTYMKIAFVGGIFVGSPLIFYQIWSFIAPGLYDNEKIYVVPVAICSALFFIAGGAFCYFVMLPNALPFLLGFGEEYMRDTPRMTEYYEFVLQLLVAFGLIFEMPLFVFFLSRLGLVTAAMLSQFRRYFVVIAFIMGAVLTPPDIMSQFFMACPMLLLYEFSIIIARIFGREKRVKKTEPEQQEKEATKEQPEQKNPMEPAESVEQKV